jgi:hypothetical protein
MFMKFLPTILILAAFFSCTNSTRDSREDKFDTGAVFYDYKISGEEGSDSVSVLLHYRFGEEGELPTVLESGSKLTFDGKEIRPDSAKLTGTFYEVMLPANEFNGTHKIAVTGKNGKSHSQEFNFQPFSLANELPAQVKMEPFAIRLNGLGSEPVRIQLVMIDTAFGTRDVNEELVVKNGELAITAKMWRALSTGPITMEIYREEEIPLNIGVKEAGRLLMTYRLKREFEAKQN